MERKIKKILLYVTGTLAIIAACIFFTPGIKSMAHGKLPEEGTSVVVRNVTIDTSGTDIPAEIKSPVQKIMNLVAWLMICIGILAILIGGIMFLSNLLTGGGHPGAGGIGFKIMIGGIIVLLLPILVNWLFPKVNLL